jgi:hypothetical protein
MGIRHGARRRGWLEGNRKNGKNNKLSNPLYPYIKCYLFGSSFTSIGTAASSDTDVFVDMGLVFDDKRHNQVSETYLKILKERQYLEKRVKEVLNDKEKNHTVQNVDVEEEKNLNICESHESLDFIPLVDDVSPILSSRSFDDPVLVPPTTYSPVPSYILGSDLEKQKELYCKPQHFEGELNTSLTLTSEDDEISKSSCPMPPHTPPPPPPSSTPPVVSSILPITVIQAQSSTVKKKPKIIVEEMQKIIIDVEEIPKIIDVEEIPDVEIVPTPNKDFSSRVEAPAVSPSPTRFSFKSIAPSPSKKLGSSSPSFSFSLLTSSSDPLAPPSTNPPLTFQPIHVKNSVDYNIASKALLNLKKLLIMDEDPNDNSKSSLPKNGLSVDFIPARVPILRFAPLPPPLSPFGIKLKNHSNEKDLSHHPLYSEYEGIPSVDLNVSSPDGLSSTASIFYFISLLPHIIRPLLFVIKVCLFLWLFAEYCLRFGPTNVIFQMQCMDFRHLIITPLCV